MTPISAGGGGWEKLKEGKFLECSETPGVEKEAGLPNITGGGNDLMPHPNVWAEGCCYVRGSGDGSASGSRVSIPGRTGIYIDASRSSPIYGKSTTVQPSSITCIMWKRVS